jgi:hypothetical protein
MMKAREFLDQHGLSGFLAWEVFLVGSLKLGCQEANGVERTLIINTKGRRLVVQSFVLLKYPHERPLGQEGCISRKPGFEFGIPMYYIRVSTLTHRWTLLVASQCIF